MRPLNLMVRSRAVTEPFTQALSKAAAFVAGVVVFAVGGAAALFAVVIGAALLRNLQAMRTAESLALVLVVGLFGLFGAVLCTAGYRLLFRSSAAAGSMLPHSLWFILCVVLGALGIFGLGASLFLDGLFAPMLISSIMMGAFSWWCYHFARRAGNDIHAGAASNNRWSGP